MAIPRLLPLVLLVACTSRTGPYDSGRPPEAHDTGSPSGDTDGPSGDTDLPGPPAPRVFAGEFDELPVTVNVPGLDVDDMPLVSVLFRKWGDWVPIYEDCRGGDSVTIRDGEVTLEDTYCTAGSSAYRITVQDADDRITGVMEGGDTRVEHPAFDPDDLPLLRVYFSWSGDEWFSVDARCQGGDSFYLQDGRITLNDTYCVGGQWRYQIVWADPKTRHTGVIEHVPLVQDPAIDMDAPPVVGLWLSRNNGGSWTQNAQNTVHGYPLYLRPGEAEINRNLYFDYSAHYELLLGR